MMDQSEAETAGSASNEGATKPGMPFKVRLLAGLLVGFSGAALQWHIMGGCQSGGCSGDFMIVFPAVAFFGAFLAGLMTADLFGKRSWSGALLACLGAASATVLGAICAGLLFSIPVLPIAPLIAYVAIKMVVGTLLSNMSAAVTWAVTLGATHLVMLRVRRDDFTP
jgi:hypothetical protein